MLPNSWVPQKALGVTSISDLEWCLLGPCVPLESFRYNRLIASIFAYYNRENIAYYNRALPELAEVMVIVIVYNDYNDYNKQK